MFFLGFLEKIQYRNVKEQSYFHAVGTLEEMNGLLKDFIECALSLVKITLANLKFLTPPEVFDLVF